MKICVIDMKRTRVQLYTTRIMTFGFRILLAKKNRIKPIMFYFVLCFDVD